MIAQRAAAGKSEVSFPRQRRGRKLASTMIEFNPRFQIMPATKSLAVNVPKIDPYKVEVGEPPPE